MKLAKLMENAIPGMSFPHTYVIAEIGINHEGDFDICAELVRAAARAGCDAVKLQTINADEAYAKTSESYNLFKNSKLSFDETRDIFRLAKSLGLDAISTSADDQSLEQVASLDPAAHKISSGLLNHIPLIKKTAQYGRPLIISTGLATLNDIKIAIEACYEVQNKKIVILQCTSLYPCPDNDVNLNAMHELKDVFNHITGYSDHTTDELACLAASVLGANVIEKHFTFDSSRPGYDHHISLMPLEMEAMVFKIRRTDKMLGTRQKQLSTKQYEARNKYYRVIVASKNLDQGSIIKDEDIKIKRAPNSESDAIEPIHYDQLIGRVLCQSIQRDEPITYKDLL